MAHFDSKELERDHPDARLRRLLFRCWHRGTRENDLLLGAFAETCGAALDSIQLGRLEALLGCPDTDLFDWILGGSQPPLEHDNDVLRLLRGFCAARQHASFLRYGQHQS